MWCSTALIRILAIEIIVTTTIQIKAKADAFTFICCLRNMHSYNLKVLVYVEIIRTIWQVTKKYALGTSRPCMYIRSIKDWVNFLSIHRTDHDRINWVSRKQLPVDSSMDMILNTCTKTCRLATDAVQYFTIHMNKFA